MGKLNEFLNIVLNREKTFKEMRAIVNLIDNDSFFCLEEVDLEEG